MSKENENKKAKQEAADKVVKAKVEQEASERAVKVKAEKEASEKVEKAKAEKDVAEKAAKDKADKDACDKNEKDKADKDAKDKAEAKDHAEKNGKSNSDDDKKDGRGHGDGDHNDDGHADNGNGGHHDHHNGHHGHHDHAGQPPVELPPAPSVVVDELPPIIIIDELPPINDPFDPPIGPLPPVIDDSAPAIVLHTLDVKDASTDDVLEGADSGDYIVGGAGNDVISGRGGDDYLIGDRVSEFTVALDIDAALINAANEHDYKLTLTAVPYGAVLSHGAQNQDGSWTLMAGDLPGLTMTGRDAGDFTIHVTAVATDGSGLSTTADLNVSLAGGNNDVISGNADNDTLYGNDGNDEMYGASKPTGVAHVETDNDNDTLHGGAGNDVLYGNSGNDALFGEADNDAMFGGKGNDRLSDGDGNDVVNANSGNDLVVAGEGDDVYSGNSGFDTIDFSAAKQGMKIDLSKKTADGMGHDTISGFENVTGSSFDDNMKGSKNAETLNGGSGDDTLRGMGGADTLTGGAGNDTFVWMKKDVVDDKGKSLGVDHVTDFAQGDKLDLHEILKGHAENLVAKDDGANTYIYAKIGGDFVGVAVLEGFTGQSTDEMLKAGMILA